MAVFSSTITISSNINSAYNILRILRNIYGAFLEVEAILARYQIDTAFRSEADHLFNTEQLTELGNMISEISTLRMDWAENHKGPLGLV